MFLKCDPSVLHTQDVEDSGRTSFNSFQASVTFHVETIRLVWRANQMTGFYMKHNISLKWVNYSNKLIKLAKQRWKSSVKSTTRCIGIITYTFTFLYKICMNGI